MNNLESTVVESSRSNLYEEKKIFEDYYNQISAIKSFVDSVDRNLIAEYDFMHEKKENTIVNLYIFSQIKNKLLNSGKTIEELKVGFDAIIKENSKIFDKVSADENIVVAFKEFLFNDRIKDGNHIIEIKENNDGVVQLGVSRKISEIYLKEYNEKLENYSIHKELLYKSSFISLVVAFELLVNNILYHKAYRNPKSIGIENKSLKFEEIINLGNTDEVINYLIENHITDIMRKPFQSWMDYLKKEFKLEVNSKVKEFDDDLTEVFQRRNVTVHASGLVNTIYLKNVNKKFSDSLRIGDKLDINIEYIDKTIDIMKIYGTNLLYNYWYKSDKESEIREDYFDNIAFQELSKENYLVSRYIYEIIIPNAKSNSDQYRFKINYWQTYKWTNEFEKVKVEIENFDLSAASIEYQLMKDILLDNFEDAFPKFTKLIDSGDWDYYSIFNWPIFKEFIKQDIVIDYFNKNE